ncbi:ribosome biogenesis GTP-binding protein YihA/YsxC [Candidatus Sneabacter namystus]|uniref:Probable GTP-binding protein EngB n=1 Tax=Candidatus Sneabacter namystus TaxID=2601646 RepID=A0A5C0UH32_9RICK|nr:ribosome biogenesis GTP-binding protein YihA/YsxC [Candidatus Sneabacter namystus]QEK39445.1 ribosome biogenesis GTP-binding protein YsxC [Candidatus Sneabacter namystus]
MSDVSKWDKMVSGDVEFVMGLQGVQDLSSYTTLPMIVFSGSSNVGKSSLISAVCRRKKLARRSKRPGSTSQINLFQVEKSSLLADMPGYGYAKISNRTSAKINKLVTWFLRYVENIALVNVLVDVRKGVTVKDIAALEYVFSAHHMCQIVLTKVDQIDKKYIDNACFNAQEEVYKVFKEEVNVIPTSAFGSFGVSRLTETFTACIENWVPSYDSKFESG